MTRRRWLWCAALLLLNCAVLSCWWHVLQPTLEDEGDVLFGAVRWLHGEVPYRDTFDFLPPLTFLLPAVWFKLCGVSLFSARLFMTAIAGGTAILAYLLGCDLMSERRALAAAVAFSLVCTPQWPVVSYHWMAMACLMVGVWGFVRGRYGVFGAGTAASMLCAQTEGLALMAAAGAWALLQATFTSHRLGWKPLSVAVRSTLVGFVAVFGPVAVGFACVGGFSPFWHDCFVWPWSHHVGFGSSPYEMLPAPMDRMFVGVLTHPLQFFSSLGSGAVPVLVVMVVHLFKHAGIPLVLAAGGWRVWHDRNTVQAPTWLFVWLATFFRYAATWSRADWAHVNFVFPLLALFLVWFVPARGESLLLALFTIVFSARGLMFVTDVARAQCTVDFPAERVVVTSPAYAFVLTRIVSYSQSHSSPGDPIFVYPDVANLYVLLQRSNPTRYNRMVPIYYSADQVGQLCQELVEHPVRYVIQLNASADELLNSYPNVDHAAFASQLTSLAQYIESRFPVVQMYPYFLVKGTRSH